ncbi:ribosomal protein L7/L12 C-terminal domain-containing protein [Paraphysoderma sedebokerense]|nr:ribosomal protein L7/L12 C-terminal domain-containing protein [Paraphysoderma sedebokerense]
METADLVELLKTRLKITTPTFSIPAGGAAPAAAAEKPKEEEKPKEKAMVTVKLEKFDTASKAKVIREIKALISGMNLVEAKKFVEGAPKVIKENVPREDAEKMKKQLEAAGGTVAFE